MSYAQAVSLSNTPRPAANVTANVLPLRSPRATLQVFLTGHAPQAGLPTLMQSALGAHVSQTDVLRHSVRVVLDIAPEDLDFTLHVLMTTLPEATIGSVFRRAGTKGR